VSAEDLTANFMMILLKCFAWRWRQYPPSKSPHSHRHDATSQKSWTM